MKSYALKVSTKVVLDQRGLTQTLGDDNYV